MENIIIDFSKTSGKIKHMNAVNNGPHCSSVRSSKTNFESYKALKIPYARNHDASFYNPYGGDMIVDVHRIFRNFDADENDPNSYIFEPTDKYIKGTSDAGTETFYRLGASIEHYTKFGTSKPKDYGKWARICEHIIRHYNEGWADGYNYNITYWEIWNEPDCHNADGSNPCWQGTDDEFIDLYEVAAKHLKKCFPNLKIGGPAFAVTWFDNDIRSKFMEAIKERDIPLDFYSYHWYGKHISALVESIKMVDNKLQEIGKPNTEKILNEWNYVRGWNNEIWDYTLDTEKNYKGASFIAAVMCVSQANAVDMLMYYDARPCGMNGLFDQKTFTPLKPYYVFEAFSKLKDMGNYVKIDANNDLYVCGATGISQSGLMITYFNDNDDGFHKDLPVPELKKNVCLDIKNPFPGKRVSAKVYATDQNTDGAIVKEEFFSSDSFKLYLSMPIFTTYYIEFNEF